MAALNSRTGSIPMITASVFVVVAVQGCGSPGDGPHIPSRQPASQVVSPDWDNQQGWIGKQRDGEFLLFVQRFDRADAKFREAVKLAEEFGAGDARVARSLTGLGRAQAAHNDWQSALIQYERALQIKRKSYGNDHSDVADLLTDLAVAKLNLNQVKESRTALDEAKAIWKHIHATTIPETMFVDAMVKDKEGNLEAEDTFKRATDMYLSQIDLHKYPQPTVSLREARDCGERYCAWLDTHGKADQAKEYRQKLQPVKEWLDLLGQS
ncbi:MAG: tetratricopeptide repeat protein [Candidatus Obscuribacterales bacterium]|nr:tetratricopeptide repeat protein [Candidatus Obscuribacterales bacterium]